MCDMHRILPIKSKLPETSNFPDFSVEFSVLSQVRNQRKIFPEEEAVFPQWGTPTATSDPKALQRDFLLVSKSALSD